MLLKFNCAFICLLFSLPTISFAEDLTMGGLNVKRLVAAYVKNTSSSELNGSLFLDDEQGKVSRKVFLIQPLSVPGSEVNFPDCIFFRGFCSRNILHDVCIIAGVTRGDEMTLLHNDEQVVNFLQRSINNHVQTVADLRKVIESFCVLRGYDILEKKPQIMRYAKMSITNDVHYSDNEWGLSSSITDGRLRGRVTVVENVYNPVIRRYDFEMFNYSSFEVTGMKDIFIGTFIK